MATHGRSSDGPYPAGQHPLGRGRPAGVPPSVQRTGAQDPVGPQSPQQETWPGPQSAPAGPAPAAHPQAAQLPPPEWADPAVGRRWTGSWRMRPTGAQPALRTPREEPARPPMRGETGAMPRRATGGWPAQGTGPRPAEQLPPWEAAGPAAAAGPQAPAGMRTTGAIRATAANPALGPTRATGANRTLDPDRTTGALNRTTGAMRATGAHKTADANTVSGAIRTTGASRTTGALPTTGAPCGRPAPCGPPSRSRRAPAGRGSSCPSWCSPSSRPASSASLYLWWRNTLFMHAHGALLIDIGEVLGLLAGYGVIILVALMARLPPLETRHRHRPAGPLARHRRPLRHQRDQRARRVHRLGLRGHRAQKNVISETATLLTTFPDVLMATVAWLLLLMVAAISLRAARRRVAYETWYYAHLYTYLAIALAFSHQFADGGAFAESLQARVAWSALYAVVGGLLLWYRVITPLRSAARHQFTVQSVRPEAPGHRVGADQRARLRPPAGRARAVLPLAVPDPGAVVAVAPLLAVGDAAARPDADHRQGPRRPQRLAGEPATGHPDRRRGPLRRVHPVADRPAGAVHRRRRRHHPDPRDVRRAAQADVRRHHPALPGQPPPRRGVQPRTQRDRQPTGRPPCTTWSARATNSATTRSTPTTCSAPSPACTATRPTSAGRPA